MNKAQQQKELAEINRQIAALDIAREIAIKKRRELEGIYPSAISSPDGELSERQKTEIIVNSFRRRKINLNTEPQ